MPSVNSRSMPNVWPSSTLTTPSLPTLSMASAMTSPISSSPAEIVATRAIWSLLEMSLACFLVSSTTEPTAGPIPPFKPARVAGARAASLKAEGVRDGGHVLEALADDRLGEHGGGGGAGAGDVVRRR